MFAAGRYGGARAELGAGEFETLAHDQGSRAVGAAAARARGLVALASGDVDVAVGPPWSPSGDALPAT